MVNRLFVEKKEGLDAEARALFAEATGMLGVGGLTRVRVVNRYDVEGVDGKLLEYAERNIFSEPQLDNVSDELDFEGAAAVFGVEPLPGQFDQRADSAAQCIQLVSQGEKPTVRTAKMYALYGELTESDVNKIKGFVINPVECREADLALPDTLKTDYPAPGDVEVLHGFIGMGEDELAAFVTKYGLAMDADDVRFCRDYFASEKRDPTLTEVRMIDTYWSDHCRHTTFLTTIDKAEFEDEEVEAAWKDYLAAREKLGRTHKPINLMDIATIAAKLLRKEGKLPDLDESEEINACRNAQPSHGDRAFRRRGDVYRRRHPRPTLRQSVRLLRDASHRRRGSSHSHRGHPSRQTAAEEDSHHCGGRLQLLRQPDRAGDGHRGRDIPQRLRRKEVGDRRGDGGCSGAQRSA